MLGNGGFVGCVWVLVNYVDIVYVNVMGYVIVMIDFGYEVESSVDVCFVLLLDGILDDVVIVDYYYCVMYVVIQIVKVMVMVVYGYVL